MPYLLPQAADNGFVDVSGDNSEVIEIGSDQWFSWLRSSSTKSFRFTLGYANRQSYTVRKEFSKNDNDYITPYWYGYKRRNKQLRKAYLGLTQNLTLNRLIEAGHYLWDIDPNLILGETSSDYGSAIQIEIPQGYFWQSSTKHAIALELLEEFVNSNSCQYNKVRSYWLSKFRDFLIGQQDDSNSPQPDSYAAVLSPRCRQKLEPLDI